MGHSCGTLLWDTLVITLVEHPRRTVWSDTVVLQVCKTSVSYKTSSKSHLSSLHQASKRSTSHETSSKTQHLKSAKQAFRTRLPPKVTRQSLQNDHVVRDFLQKSSGKPRSTHTHIKQPCQAVSRFQRPLIRQSQCQSDIHLHHNSRPHDSRFPAPATKIYVSTRLTAHKVLRLHDM